MFCIGLCNYVSSELKLIIHLYNGSLTLIFKRKMSMIVLTRHKTIDLLHAVYASSLVPSLSCGDWVPRLYAIASREYCTETVLYY